MLQEPLKEKAMKKTQSFYYNLHDRTFEEKNSPNSTLFSQKQTKSHSELKKSDLLVIIRKK